MFYTGNAAVTGNPWNQVSGDRYDQSSLASTTTTSGKSWDSVLSISSTTVADEKDYKCEVTILGKTLTTDVAKLYVIRKLGGGVQLH